MNRIGIFIGRDIDKLGKPHVLQSITSWRGLVSPKRSAAISRAARDNGIILEGWFDAAHGRRYLCLAYSNSAERLECIDFLCGGHLLDRVQLNPMGD